MSQMTFIILFQVLLNHAAYTVTYFFNQKIVIVIVRKIFKVRFIEKVFRHLIALFAILANVVSCKTIQKSLNKFYVSVLVCKSIEWFQ